ncbi:UDP-glucose:glyco glucosyltransferase [Babesia ovis]|uniref:Protein ARV n=1 Tax=Babesia ovis TaxID=5869 RepID=A0A9W5T9H9_BABOV|nr:UDP-glucose:glyco glucosyltransferase [Babesia ovis]
MLVCVHCGSVVPTLYHEGSKESICLETCGTCGEIADMYVEWDIYITAIELFLLKVAVFRHLIYNQNAKPSSVGSQKTKRKRISKILLLFASAVILDGYRVMVTCRFITKSQEWCNKDVLLQQQQVLEGTTKFFEENPISSFGSNYEKVSGDGIIPFSEEESTTTLLHNMVQSILAASQLKIIKAREEMGVCNGFDSRSVVDRFFILALEEPSLFSLGNLTCQKFGECNILFLCMAKLAGYCVTIVIIHKLYRMWNGLNRSLKDDKSIAPKVDRFSTSMDVLLAVLLCIHIKALVLMMIIWYPRLALLGAVELYAYFSNVLAINAACNMTLKEASAVVLCAIGVKILIHYVWLVNQ